ncbi:MAG TPA: hypothetical protein VGJ30_17350 [Candidatus Angelobacter sp.]|jgi:hypothetical protein
MGKSRWWRTQYSRYLELADIALGLKKSASHRKKNQLPSAHDRKKTEPYASK